MRGSFGWRWRGYVCTAATSPPTILLRSLRPRSSSLRKALKIWMLIESFVRLAGLPNGRVPADGGPGRTDDGRVVRDFKLETHIHFLKCTYIELGIYQIHFTRLGFNRCSNVLMSQVQSTELSKITSTILLLFLFKFIKKFPFLHI